MSESSSDEESEEESLTGVKKDEGSLTAALGPRRPPK